MPAERATHDRIYGDALRLLHDAGCDIFRPAPLMDSDSGEPQPPARPERPNADDGEGGQMTIGISTVPPGAEEFELRFLGLWARGYQAGDRFVVAAGSEMRLQTNESVGPLTRKRREQLLGAGVTSPIPGVADRRRPLAAVAFPTGSIAAKSICGAHTPAKWISLEPAKAVWLAV